MLRRKLIAGNWKMNGLRQDLHELEAIARAASGVPEVDVAIFPPFILLEEAVRRCPHLLIGAQDCAAHDAGSYTGDVSARMLKDAGARAVIIGHSERRAFQHEQDAQIASKSSLAAESGLLAIVCIGETAQERQAGEAENVVAGHLWNSISPRATAANTAIAYEPIWAIGTGNTPSEEALVTMHAFIRATLCRKLGETAGAAMRVLYGGSVNDRNAAAILRIPNVDGALVGKASLKASAFNPIVEASL